MSAPPPGPPPPAGGFKAKKIVSETESFVPINPIPEPKTIPIDPFDWSSVTRLNASSDGSSGVLFVHNKEGTAVLKSSQSEGDIVALLLHDHFGIKTPKFKAITRQHEAWKKIENIKSDKALRFSFMDQSSRRRLDGMVKYQQFLLLEYIPAKPLHSLGEWVKLLEVHPDSGVGHPLYQIGQASAIDLIINNWDRIPSFWKNQGNPGNIIVKENGDVVVIDQIVSPVTSDTDSKTHFDKVSKFLDEFLLFPDKVQQELPFKFELGEDISSLTDPKHRIRAFFINNVGYDIGPNGITLVCQGFTDMSKKLTTITQETVDHLYTRAWQAICEGFTEVSNMSDPKDVEFIMKGVSLIQSKLLQ